MSVLETLKERGFIKQLTDEEEISKLLESDKVTFYIGFDPTADSLHVGHFLTLMAMAHMQRAGHRPIALIGGGTAMVGDPSGRTDMRKMLSKETIQNNVNHFKKQMARFIDFSDGKAIIANNADWLYNLNYIDFLRDIGSQFSVNRMLTAECFKQRLERGLSFLEFNYMLMQGYDFLQLSQRYGCTIELGGDDQWSNIIAGIELIRRKTQKPAYGMTFTLLTNSEGKKMGKTQSGAVWLDHEKTSPYDFYQYFRNVDDADVEKCLSLLTFLPMDEIRRLGSLKDEKINEAKKVLAYEVTKLVHGEEEAKKAKDAAEALFSQKGSLDNVPSIELSNTLIGSKVLDVLSAAKIIPSKSEGRRLIQQGGLSVSDKKISDIDTVIDDSFISNGSIIIKKGKKKYYQVIFK